MHEITIVRQMVHTIEEYAKQNDVDSVKEVVLDVGELSLVIPKYVDDVFPMVSEGTILEGAKLIYNSVEGLAECEDCDEIFNVVKHEGYCPNCGSFDKVVLSGKEFLIKEIHV